MIKNIHYSVLSNCFAIICLSLCMVTTVHATNIIYPDNTIWQLDERNNIIGDPVISDAHPRSGNASLALTTTGSLYDWAFYTRYAGDPKTSSWGLLSDVSALSFDWYRQAMPIKTEYQSDVPWLAQTPVLRLLVRDGADTSELVWEKYYSDSSPAIMNTWSTEDLADGIDDNLWRHVDGIGYTIGDGTNKDPFFPDPLLAINVSSWNDYYTENAVVYGLSVGVGSNWPDVYSGAVDNIFLSFKNNIPDIGITITTAVNDNFELPIPEPATLLLFGSGIGILAVSRKWRRKSCRM
jgi:hypothetical protein